GYILVRVADAPRGVFAVLELIGMLLFAAGFVCYTFSVLPISIQDQIREKTRIVRPVQNLDPPIVTPTEVPPGWMFGMEMKSLIIEDLNIPEIRAFPTNDAAQEAT